MFPVYSADAIGKLPVAIESSSNALIGYCVRVLEEKKIRRSFRKVCIFYQSDKTKQNIVCWGQSCMQPEITFLLNAKKNKERIGRALT